MELGQISGAPAKKPGREIVIKKIFDAPRDLVFEMWTDPAHLAQWWGPKGFQNPVCELDVRVGGEWKILMRSPDGTEHSCRGVYREIAPPAKLVFTNVAVDERGNPIIEGFTTVTFADAGGKTEVTLRTRAVAVVTEAAAKLAGMDAGWSQSLDRLAERLHSVSKREKRP